MHKKVPVKRTLRTKNVLRSADLENPTWPHTDDGTTAATSPATERAAEPPSKDGEEPYKIDDLEPGRSDPFKVVHILKPPMPVTETATIDTATLGGNRLYCVSSTITTSAFSRRAGTSTSSPEERAEQAQARAAQARIRAEERAEQARARAERASSPLCEVRPIPRPSHNPRRCLPRLARRNWLHVMDRKRARLALLRQRRSSRRHPVRCRSLLRFHHETQATIAMR